MVASFIIGRHYISIGNLLFPTMQGHVCSCHNPFPQQLPATTLSPAHIKKRLRVPRFITACTDLWSPAYLPPPPRTPVEISRNLHPPPPQPGSILFHAGGCKRIQPYKGEGGGPSPPPPRQGSTDDFMSQIRLVIRRAPLIPYFNFGPSPS